MTKIVLNELHLVHDSNGCGYGANSYISALHAVLSGKGWFSGTLDMLAGMTAMAFRFTVHRSLRATAFSAYNWMAEHFLAADFIGLLSSQNAGFTFDATFPLYQKHAVAEIKASIDRGMGAIFWKDGFEVACGYDDASESLFYCDGTTDEPKPLAYDEFGCNLSPYWYVQTCEDRMAMNRLSVYKESLVQALYRWEAHEPLLPEREYACGFRAYDAVQAAVFSGEYDREDIWTVMDGLSAAKRSIAAYTDQISREWEECREVAGKYVELAIIAARMADCRKPELGGGAALGALCPQAKAAEEAAVGAIKKLMRETAGNREGNIGLR